MIIVQVIIIILGIIKILKTTLTSTLTFLQKADKIKKQPTEFQMIAYLKL